MYICKDGQTVEGPLPADQVWRMVQAGQVDPATLTSIADNPDQWIPFQELPNNVFSDALLASIQKSNASDVTDEAIGQGCLVIVLLGLIGIAFFLAKVM